MIIDFGLHNDDGFFQVPLIKHRDNVTCSKLELQIEIIILNGSLETVYKVRMKLCIGLEFGIDI